MRSEGAAKPRLGVRYDYEFLLVRTGCLIELRPVASDFTLALVRFGIGEVVCMR